MGAEVEKCRKEGESKERRRHEGGKKIYEKGGQRKNLGIGENGNKDPPGHRYKYTVK